MGGASIWHWLVILLYIVPLAWGCAVILRRLGYSPVWAVLAFLPFINVISLVAFAYAKWPALRREG